jgi:hypothetical protein
MKIHEKRPELFVLAVLYDFFMNFHEKKVGTVGLAESFHKNLINKMYKNICIKQIIKK